MKKIIFIFLFIFLSFEAIAANESRSMRTPSGKIISIGDTYISMIDKLPEAPISSRSYDIKERHSKITVNEYVYLVYNIYYTFTVINNSITSISWERKS